MTVEQRLERMEAMLALLVERQQSREWYSIEQFSLVVGRSVLTCREWCRLGRIAARKQGSGRGAHDQLPRRVSRSSRSGTKVTMRVRVTATSFSSRSLQNRAPS